MGIRTSPAFDAEMVGGSPDRIYQLPDSIPPMMEGVVTTGVVNNLWVSETSPASMATLVGNGRAYVEGVFVEVFGGGETVAHQPGDSQSRVDLVVMRLDRLNRTLTPRVLKGTPGSSTAPIPWMLTTVRDLPLREVVVPANATFLSSVEGQDRRIFANLLTTGAPAATNHAANKSYVDNIGTTAATGNTIARRNSTGRLVAAAPSAPGELATKGYVDNYRNAASVQAFSTSNFVDVGSEGVTNIAIGTVSMPSGWSLYDLLFDGYYEVRLRGSIHWRFSVTPQIQVGGTWVNATPTSHMHSVVHFSATSATNVYSQVAVTGRVLGLGGDQALRWRHEHSASSMTDPSNKRWETNRRTARVTLLRRS